MSKQPFLIPSEKYQFYADYFAIAAEAGLEVGRSLYKAIDPLERVNFNSFEKYENAAVSRNTLLAILQSSYEQIFTNAVSLDPMRDAFVALADHILQYYGSPVNTYLSDNSLKVKRTYARIHRLATGETISDANIED